MTAHTPAKDILPTLQRSARDAFAPIQREVNRVFDQLGEGLDTVASLRMLPAMDVMETDSALELSMELPGLVRDDVKVTVAGDILTVRGEKRSTQDIADGRHRVAERSFGEFARSILLPSTVDGARVSAAMKDGVLIVTAPKVEDAKTHSIEIQSA